MRCRISSLEDQAISWVGNHLISKHSNVDGIWYHSIKIDP